MVEIWGPIRRFSIIAAAVTALTACGGDGNSGNGGDGGTVKPPSTNVPRCTSVTPLVTTDIGAIRFKTESQYGVGQSSAIIGSLIHSDSQELSFRWQQLDGPSIELVSQNSPVLALEIPTAGSYRFRLQITGTDTHVSEEISIIADNNTGQWLNIRQDHQAVEGNDVSLRIGQQAGLSAANINWCIAEGPEVTVDISDPFRPLFSAPSVVKDSLIRLQASANINGMPFTDEAVVLITAAPAISSSYFDTPLARTHAYQPSSPYANALTSCVYSNQLKQPCTVNQLPLIGQLSDSLDVDTILNRLLVSHDWMGDNFAAFLRQMDPNSDFARLLQSVTAVVISYDVRPSFYWVVTGAIYLDPNDLWLTPMQRDSINEAPDYRSNFGNELNFIMPWRYVKNNQYASQGFPISARTTRTLAQINPDLASLLYHELAHANDFFPRSVHAALTGPRLLDDYNRRNANKSLISDQVSLSYPLTSAEMSGLAGVSFLGAKATASQKAYQAADVSTFFSGDNANDFYAYSSSREDTAMLFEEAMMSYRYQIQRDVAVTNAPEVITADTIIVNWGQRGRIGADDLVNRAALVIDGMLPELDGIHLLASLPEPIQMTQGQSWRQSLATSPAASVKGLQSIKASSDNLTEPELRFSGDRHRHPQQ